MMIWTFRLFATRGRGTLAPWAPTEKLVVAGPYRHCRNRMITGVVTLLAGEALVTLSPWLGSWALAFWLTNAIYIPLREEPRLLERVGDDYARYRRSVSRWIPSLSPRAPLE